MQTISYSTDMSFSQVLDAVENGKGLPFQKKKALCQWWGALAAEGVFDTSADYYVPVQGPGECLANATTVDATLAIIERVFAAAGLDRDMSLRAEVVSSPKAKPAPVPEPAAEEEAPAPKRPSPRGAPAGSRAHAANATSHAAKAEPAEAPVPAAHPSAGATGTMWEPHDRDLLYQVASAQTEVLQRIVALDDAARARHAQVMSVLEGIASDNDTTLALLETMMEMESGGAEELRGSRPSREQTPPELPSVGYPSTCTVLLGVMAESMKMPWPADAPLMMNRIRNDAGARMAALEAVKSVHAEWGADDPRLENVNLVSISTNPTTALLQLILAETQASRGATLTAG